MHGLSGTHGCFFEPRGTDVPGPDPTYAVIWMPKSSLNDALHKVRTVDNILAVTRLGAKYGVRCLSRHEEALHQELRPDRPFVQCEIKEVYRIEPLPVGTQRQSLVDVLQTIGWSARPMQPCRGSQGKAWQVGASGPPSSPFLETKHGWLTISKLKDAASPAPTTAFVATQRTKQHIRSQPSTGSQDPWLAPGSDPWATWGGPKPSTGVPIVTEHVQRKIDDVQQKIHDEVIGQVNTTLTAQTQHAAQKAHNQDLRLGAVEQQLHSLKEQQSRLEQWCADGSRSIDQVQKDQAQIHSTVQQVVHQVGEQGQAINGLRTEVGGIREQLTTSLDSYFEKQAERIEAMLAKKRCT